MNINKINLCNPLCLSAWEAFNDKYNENSFFQSSVWARYLKVSKIPFEAFEFFTFNNEKIAQILCWLEPPSFFKKLQIPPKFAKLLHLISPRLCWKDGPIIKYENKILSDQIILCFLESIKTKNILSGICSVQLSKKPHFKMNLNLSTYGTFIINLNLNEDELFNKLKHSAKKNIKKEGILVRKMESNEIIHYTSLLKKYRSELKLPVPYHACNPVLHKVCSTDSFFHVIGAFENKTLIGALCLIGYRNKLIEIGVARDTDSKYDGVAQDHIKWFIIKHAASWGFKEFDLAGFNPDDNSEKAQGIRRFKEKWGGVEKKFSHFQKI